MIKQENVPTCAVAQLVSKFSNASNLRCSGRSNMGQNPNRLIEDRSDAINLGKGSSRNAMANMADVRAIARAHEGGPSLTCR
jgi:hypothetical protein